MKLDQSKFLVNKSFSIFLLRRYAITYQDQHDSAAQNVQKYLANPINAYLLVKRLTIDWKQVESLMGATVGNGK